MRWLRRLCQFHNRHVLENYTGLIHGSDGEAFRGIYKDVSLKSITSPIPRHTVPPTPQYYKVSTEYLCTLS